MCRWYLGPQEHYFDADEEPIERLREQVERERLNAELRRTQQVNTQAALCHLWESTLGKQVDERYVAYCSTLVRDFLTDRHVTDPVLRKQIMKDVLTEHLRSLDQNILITPQVILGARHLNYTNKGIWKGSVWWNPFTWHKDLTIAQSENQQVPLPESALYKSSQMVAVGCLGIVTTMAVTYVGFRAYRHLQNIITIPKIGSPQSPQSEIDTRLLSALSTTLMAFQNSTNTSESSESVVKDTLGSSTSTELMMALSERSIKALSKALNQVVELTTELYHSLRSKN